MDDHKIRHLSQAKTCISGKSSFKVVESNNNNLSPLCIKNNSIQLLQKGWKCILSNWSTDRTNTPLKQSETLKTSVFGVNISQVKFCPRTASEVQWEHSICFLWRWKKKKKSSPKKGIQPVVTDAGPKKLSGCSILLCKVRGEHDTFIIAHSSFSLNHVWIQSKKLIKDIKLLWDWIKGCHFVLYCRGIIFYSLKRSYIFSQDNAEWKRETKKYTLYRKPIKGRQISSQSHRNGSK